jgi:O-antigen/teichoic acid export membrane protein
LSYLIAAIVFVQWRDAFCSFAAPTQSLWSAWQSRRAATLWHLGSYIAYSTYSIGFPIILAAVAPTATVGAFAASRLLVTPPLAIVTALEAIDKPRAASAYATSGRDVLTRIRYRAQLQALVLTSPYFIVVLWFSNSIQTLLYGKNYSFPASIVLLWAIFAVLTAVNQSQETSLLILGRTRGLFAAKVLAAVAGSSIVLGQPDGLTVFSATVAATTAMGVNVLCTLVCLAIASRRTATEVRGVIG